jgi:hypothetical protein
MKKPFFKLQQPISNLFASLFLLESPVRAVTKLDNMSSQILSETINTSTSSVAVNSCSNSVLFINFSPLRLIKIPTACVQNLTFGSQLPIVVGKQVSPILNLLKVSHCLVKTNEQDSPSSGTASLKPSFAVPIHFSFEDKNFFKHFDRTGSGNKYVSVSSSSTVSPTIISSINPQHNQTLSKLNRVCR